MLKKILPENLELSPHLKAISEAVFVTFLWSTSWVLIKIGLKGNLPPVTFAGLRYVIAFFCLLPFVMGSARYRKELASLSPGKWFQLTLLGLVFYSLTQGAQFLSLAYLPAAMVSLVLNLTAVTVGFAGIVILKEKPGRIQWLAIGITLAGVLIYFSPLKFPDAQIVGLLFALLCLSANSASSIIGRYINAGSGLSPLIITFVSMGTGSVVLLIIGLAFQGAGQISLSEWLIIIWLAAVNTAFAFTLWNKTLQVLSAVESSVINSLMLPQIALFAFIFLAEDLSIKEISGLVLVTAGVAVFQAKRRIS